ncbi:hypothetical protein [Haloarcula pellucida]|uniref:Uncharacterized protein n=1 Tax=Haloarcula pellucida TaxID=1427151 RepID=A0A830GJK4_9EURY|nr:hypothetical protein [Halomicroarcula pellucida]GGN88469.1 hypothetical protein GCM10009030_08240 [Halomicroarcula pellucida]
MADPGLVRLFMILIVIVVMLVSIVASMYLVKFLIERTFES